MTVLLLTHIIAVGVWLGCIATESVMEAGREKSISHHQAVAEIHKWIDIFVEIPMVILVLVTGVLLFSQHPQPDIIKIKVALGLIAISLNLLCFYFIIKRNQLFITGNDTKATTFSKYQDIAGGIMIMCILAVVSIGFKHVA